MARRRRARAEMAAMTMPAIVPGGIVGFCCVVVRAVGMVSGCLVIVVGRRGWLVIVGRGRGRMVVRIVVKVVVESVSFVGIGAREEEEEDTVVVLLLVLPKLTAVFVIGETEDECIFSSAPSPPSSYAHNLFSPSGVTVSPHALLTHFSTQDRTSAPPVLQVPSGSV